MTKRGYIVKHQGKWVVAEIMNYPLGTPDYIEYDGNFYVNPIPIHPDYLPTILDGDNLKAAYQGEVEYELDEDYVKPDKGLNVYAVPISYAIPKVSEDNVYNFKHSKIADIRNKLTPLLTICEIVRLEKLQFGSSLNMTELAETGLNNVKHICTVLDSMEVSERGITIVEDKGDVWEEDLRNILIEVYNYGVSNGIEDGKTIDATISYTQFVEQVMPEYLQRINNTLTKI